MLHLIEASPCHVSFPLPSELGDPRVGGENTAVMAPARDSSQGFIDVRTAVDLLEMVKLIPEGRRGPRHQSIEKVSSMDHAHSCGEI